MNRLLLLASAVILSLAATPAIANDDGRLPQPTRDAYALAPQATLAAPALLPSSTAGIAILPAPIADGDAAGPFQASSAPQLTMASIGGVLASGAAAVSAPDRQGPRSDPIGERLPSTPIALAALLLMICILVGRRNRPDRI